MNSVPDKQAQGFSTSFIDVDGHRLRVSVRKGNGQRPPLLLLNGLGASMEALQPFVDALGPETGVVRFDVPGVGQSDTPLLPYRLWKLARLTKHLLNRLDIPVVDALGISWGGALAQQFALQNPRRCRRLILVSTMPGVGIPGGPKVFLEMLSQRRFGDAEHASRVAPKIYGGKAAQPDAVLPPFFEYLQNPGRGVFYQQLAMLGWTSLPFARLIRQSTLILTGDDDRIIPPANGHLMRLLFPNAELHIFHDGHLGLVTSADEIAPVVENFVNRS